MAAEWITSPIREPRDRPGQQGRPHTTMVCPTAASVRITLIQFAGARAALRLLVGLLIRAHGIDGLDEVVLRRPQREPARLVVGEQHLAVLHHALQIGARQALRYR